MSFAVPGGSSDPPSTPDRRSTRSHPSTTPAGPPPSHKALPSFTPKGLPPPSSAFGSSLFGTGNYTSSRSKPLFPGRIPDSSPPVPLRHDDYDEDEDDDVMEDEEEVADDSLANLSPGFNPFANSTRTDAFAASLRNNAPTFNTSMGKSARPNAVVNETDYYDVARALAADAQSASLDEPGELILETERIIEQLADKRSPALSESLTDVATELGELWRTHGPMEENGAESEFVGPEDPDAKLPRANFLASLALAIHHPPYMEQHSSRPYRFTPSASSARRPIQHQSEKAATPFPKVLLDWMDMYHNPSAPSIESVLEHTDGYSSSPAFWDAVFLSLTRAKFDITIRLLRGANYRVAVSDEGFEVAYSAEQLANIERVLDQAARLLETAPGLSSNDWDVKGEAWSVFRLRVELTKEALQSFVEVESRREMEITQSSRFGRSSTGTGFGESSAASKVPFEIYESIQDMYSQLLGGREDLFKSSFDWVEAVFALTIWWNGDDGAIPKGSVAANRKSLSRYHQTRQVDVSPGTAYRQQLATAFQLTMNEEDLRDSLDPNDPIQIGLVCIFTGDTEGLLGILRPLSMPIATTLAEIASAGGWLTDKSITRGIASNFDPDDLMVLNFGQDKPEPNQKEKLLSEYAGLLSGKKLELPDQQDIEGWQLALRVLGRLEDNEDAQKKVAELLEHTHFDRNAQVDHVLQLCNDLGFNRHAMSITEKYADYVADNTHRYGDALLYYTRAHKFDKAKRVIDVLISSCLFASTAYPSLKDMDERLLNFVKSPTKSLADLATIDLIAAEKLSAWLSGYATLREFYDLRDEDVNLKDGETPKNRPLARKRSAAKALLAVIASSSDCIRGGLFDYTAEVVVPVDCLLVLVGEALPLLNQTARVLTLPQIYALLKAIEDLQTIGPRIYANCEAVFQTALENVHGSDIPSPRARLRKEMSGMTGSSAFSMVGSSMLNSKGSLATTGSEGSGVLVSTGQIKRGWDWRQGLRRNTSGEDVLRVARLALSKEVARAWADGEDRV